MGSLVLYFFSLILKVFFNLAPNIIYKCGRFFKILLEKGLKLISSYEFGSILFFFYPILLLSKIDPISKKQGCKKDAFIAYSSSHFEIVLALLAKIIIFYKKILIIECN